MQFPPGLQHCPVLISQKPKRLSSPFPQLQAKVKIKVNIIQERCSGLVVGALCTLSTGLQIGTGKFNAWDTY